MVLERQHTNDIVIVLQISISIAVDAILAKTETFDVVNEWLCMCVFAVPSNAKNPFSVEPFV